MNFDLEETIEAAVVVACIAGCFLLLLGALVGSVA